MAAVPSIAVRGCEGISLLEGAPPCKPHKPFEERESSSRCRVMLYSDDGKLFAWCNGQCVTVIEVSSGKVVSQLPRSITMAMKFSPQNTFLSTWQQYMITKDIPAGTNNLEIWRLSDGECVKGFIQKKFEGWDPKWSHDENICGRTVSNEIQFYQGGNFSHIFTKLRLESVTSFSLSPGSTPVKVAAHVAGKKGAPSYVRVYQYPNFENAGAVLANKSFFKADKVDLFWNQNGSAVLVLTSTDEDKTGASYYGEQALHYVSTDGESCLVPLAKRGPVYDIAWSPNSKEFCAVYGFMPAKATLFNQKCEPLFDFGTGPRNEVHYNAHGNIICLAGFGNLRGTMEFWSRKDFKLISAPIASDSTFFEWCPDGQHVLTATTSPRLREGNGFKIWHYTGGLVYERSYNEIYEVRWQPTPVENFKEVAVMYKPVAGLHVEQPKPKVAAYRPPGLRGTVSALKNMRNDEPPQNQKTQEMTKSALKNKKKREAKLKSKQEQNTSDEAQARQPVAPTQSLSTPQQGQGVTLNPEQEKKIKNLKKKLKQIQDLKEKQKSGVTLEKNQIDKIQTEDDILKEIQQLQLS